MLCIRGAWKGLGGRSARLVRAGALALLTWGLLTAGCATPPAPPPAPAPRAEPAAPSPAEPPAPPPTAEAPDHPPPTTPPAEPEPAAPPADDAAVAEPMPPAPPAEPAIPAYLAVLNRFDPAQTVMATAHTGPGNRLVVDTRNVRRLRIDRAALPLQRGAAIVLRLDGQPIEWLADSEVTVFERSINGDWTPVRPAQREATRRD